MNKQLRSKDRVAEAKAKKAKAQYEPTWAEVWQTIASRKNSDSDIKKLKEVKQAIDAGEIGSGVDSLKKFSKAHALRLYTDLLELRREQYIADTVASMPDNYHCVTTGIQFQQMIDLLEQETEIGLDTETTGVEHDDHIVGISMTFPQADQHYYIPVRHVYPSDASESPVMASTLRTDQLDAETVFNALKPFYESSELYKIGHNLKFDSHKLYKEGIDLKGISVDTMIAMHVLNENETSYGLKNLASKYGKHFGFEDKSWDYSTLFGKTGFQAVPFDIGTYYACKDTHLAVRFAEWIRSFFKEQPSLAEAYAIENRTLEVAIEMERHGVILDVAFAREYADRLKTEIDSLEESLLETIGIDNLNSNQQLLAGLKRLGVLPEDATSVDKNTLKPLKGSHKVVADLLHYRKLTKLHGTYISPLPDKVRDTGRLHGSFNQASTVTGRFSSNHPNLQNLPEDARRMFKPDTDCIFVGIDFSQIEPRYLAHVSGDADFQHPYKEGIDLYSTLASKTFNVPFEECGDGSKYRKDMKLGLLATMYGISPFNLADSLGLTTEGAEQFLQDFLDAFPVTAKWIDSIHELACNQGYVEMLGGRKRRFIGLQKTAKAFLKLDAEYRKQFGDFKSIWHTKLPYDKKKRYQSLSSEYHRAMRQSVNAIIQGSSATIMKLAMIAVHDWIKSEGKPFKMLMTIHDEVIIEIPADTPREDITKMQELMCNCVSLSVELKTDAEIMTDNWGDKQSLDSYYCSSKNF